MAVFSAASALFGVSGKASSIMGSIAGHWREILMALLIATVVYQNTFQNRIFFWADTIPYLRELVSDQENAINEIAEANAKLAEAIERTNSEIENARQVTVELEAQKNRLEGELVAQRETVRQQVKLILDKPVPQSCEAAVGFLRDMIPNLNYNNVGRRQ